MSLTPSRHRRSKEVGHQGLKTPQWSAVRRAGSRKAGAALRRSRGGYMRLTALRSLFFEGSKSKRKSGTRAESRSGNDRAWPGEVGTGSPSGHASKRRETWLFDNLDRDARAFVRSVRQVTCALPREA